LNSIFSSQFELAARNQSRIQLMNSYKGLPVGSEGTILQVDRDVIRVKCELPQLACLQLEKQTYMKGPDLQGTIQAQSLSLDITRQEAILYNFGRVKGDIGQRSQVRVEPETPVTVLLQAGYHAAAVKGGLLDICTSGVGIYLDRILYSPRLYAVGADLNIQFTLTVSNLPPPPLAKTGSLSLSPASDPTDRFSSQNLRGIKETGLQTELEPKRPAQPVSVSKSPVVISTHGQVEYCFLAPPYTSYRLGISLEKSNSFRSVIVPFVAERQSDLIREFRWVCTSLAARK
jgi:hypothetical protein